MTGRGLARRGRGLGLAVCGVTYAMAAVVAIVVARALAGHHPLLVVAAADLAATVVVYVGSVLVDNSSMYDPYWSVAPLPIGLYFAWGPGAPGADRVRAALMLGLVCLWGARLTYNWARGWEGLGHEDFRYVDVRRKSGRFYWPASLLALHLMPTAVVFGGCLSLYAALGRPAEPFGAIDVLAVLVTLAAISVEARADKELLRFLRDRKDTSGTLSSGLWAYSRHPNYFGEVLFWWGLFVFALAADRSNAWTVVGPLAMTCLFVFVSVPLMDKRMRSRHPGYDERMKRVSGLVPWVARRS